MKPWNSPVVLPAVDAWPDELKLYDTVAQRVRTVGPAAGNKVATMYVCGITPYDATHLGHAFTYVVFDLVNRIWLDQGLKVRYAQNVTDVDDPLLERADATGVNWRDLADSEVERFCTDMSALRVLAPDAYPCVSESMSIIESYLQDLRSAGQLYQIEDEYPDWYFSFDQGLGYGAESHLGRAEMLKLFAERGGDPDRPGKRQPLDPVVWRQARPGEPVWQSSFGAGRPGWHIECVALACTNLGDTIDLQGGGSDLIFPHHEMCAAQGRAISGKPFARAFVHTGLVGLDGQKMSKSVGNLVKVNELVDAGADPMAIRLALLAHHYRTDWSWTKADLDQAGQRLDLWREVVGGATSVDFGPCATAVRQFLYQDLQCDRALEAIDEWAWESLDATTDAGSARGEMASLVDVLLGVALA